MFLRRAPGSRCGLGSVGRFRRYGVIERDGFSSPQSGAGGFGMGIVRWDGYPGGNVVCSGAGWIGTT